MMFRKALPEVFGATVRDIKGFAASLLELNVNH